MYSDRLEASVRMLVAPATTPSTFYIYIYIWLQSLTVRTAQPKGAGMDPIARSSDTTRMESARARLEIIDIPRRYIPGDPRLDIESTATCNLMCMRGRAHRITRNSETTISAVLETHRCLSDVCWCEQRGKQELPSPQRRKKKDKAGGKTQGQWRRCRGSG